MRALVVTGALAVALIVDLSTGSAQTGGNPAALFCVQSGGKSEIRTRESGAQYGICIFPNGQTVDEWDYYRAQASRAPSCRQTAGPQRSRELVHQCLQVSPATHPPCNADNPCDLIVDEIKRGCAMLTSRAPPFCGQHRRRKGGNEVEPSS